MHLYIHIDVVYANPILLQAGLSERTLFFFTGRPLFLQEEGFVFFFLSNRIEADASHYFRKVVAGGFQHTPIRICTTRAPLLSLSLTQSLSLSLSLPPSLSF